MLQERVIVTHVRNKKLEGTIFSESFFPIQQPDGTVILEPRIGVMWDDVRSPAVNYYRPEELEWLRLEPAMTETEIVETEDDDEQTEDDGENTLVDGRFTDASV